MNAPGADTESITGVPVDVQAAPAPPNAARAPTPARPSRRLTGRPRRLLRAGHVVVAGGWFGLVVAMLVLGVTARTAASVELAASAYRLMARIGGAVIPPMAVATMLSGVVLSLVTPWGLVRHWWIVAKAVLGLVVIVTAVSLTDSWITQAVADASVVGAAGTRLVVASVVHLAMLAVATVISVDKPWGRTPVGRRRPGSAQP